VVKENGEVAIVFKPANPSGKATEDEVVNVVKIDVQRDLALVRPRSLPNHIFRPLQISSQDIEVGADHGAKLSTSLLLDEWHCLTVRCPPRRCRALPLL
jgi:hypothetical protein